MKFYRFEIRYQNEYNGASLATVEFKLLRETLCGYWIVPTWALDRYDEKLKKWIPKKSLSRYAYPTKDEALKHYVYRTKKRKQILKHQIQLCEAGLQIAEDFSEKLLDN